MSRIRGLVVGFKLGDVAGAKPGDVVGLRLEALAGAKLEASAGAKPGDVVGLRLEALAGAKLEALAGAKPGDVVGLKLDALAGAKLEALVGLELEALVGFELGGVVGFELGGIPLLLRADSKRASDLTDPSMRAEGSSFSFGTPRVSCEPTGAAPAAPVAPMHDTRASGAPTTGDVAHHDAALDALSARRRRAHTSATQAANAQRPSFERCRWTRQAHPLTSAESLSEPSTPTGALRARRASCLTQASGVFR